MGLSLGSPVGDQVTAGGRPPRRPRWRSARRTRCRRRSPAWPGWPAPVTMPTTCPARLSSGPPLLPGLTAASNWMSPDSVVPLPRSDARSVADTTPAVRLCGEAERVADGEDRVADRRRPRHHRGHHHLGQPVRRRARRCRSPACSPSGSPRPWCRRRTRAGSGWRRRTTCSAVSTAPAALMTTPLPSRVSMSPVAPAGSARCGRHGDERRRDRVVGGGGVGRRVALLLLRLLEAVLHGPVDVGLGDRRGPLGQQPEPEGEHRRQRRRQQIEKRTPPAPTGPVPLCCLRLPNRRRGLGRSHFAHTTPRTEKSR